jgi:uncharacterized protein with ParB-like and HNH nuclease domain
MARNYTDAAIELRKLVEDASTDSGATLLIPDLQRPFVWTPMQVVLLVDSLLRGWPPSLLESCRSYKRIARTRK